MLVTKNIEPNTITADSNLNHVTKKTCIDIQVKPKPRLGNSCYSVTTVVQKCSYQQGVTSGNSDGYLNAFNLTYERYGICVRNQLFVNGYKDGFFKTYDPEFGNEATPPVLKISKIDNSPVIQGVNYDYRTDTYFVTNTSIIDFFDAEYNIGRLYLATPDELVNSEVEDYYDGNFRWTIADTSLQPYDETYVNVWAFDLGMQVSKPSELRVTIMDKSDIPDIDVSGSRDTHNNALIYLDVEVLNFKDGLKVYDDGMPIEFDGIDVYSVEYETMLEEFYKNSSTVYFSGSYLVYSETDGLVGEYPFEIEKGKNTVSIETYTSHIENLKIVFKLRAKEYLKSGSDFGYAEVYIDAVPDTVDRMVIGQLSKPYWYGLSSIKLKLLNYKQGHKYSVYLRMSSELNDPNYETRYEVNALYLSDLTRDTFYIPYDEYQFLEYETGQYEYYWIGGVYVFDVTNGDIPDFTNAVLYVPQVDNTAIEKVAHWAGVSNGASTTRTDNYYLKPTTGFGVA